MVPCRAHLATLVLGVAVAISTSCTKPQQLSSVSESIDSLMASLQEQGYLVSGAVVAGRDDEILYERGFGLANVAEGVPFTPDTPAYGASMAKTLTAAAILMLQEEGRVRLDDPVTEYLPGFPYPEIKVRHLLEHSTGLLPDGPLLSSLAPRGEEHTNELLLDLLVEHTPPLAFTPGSGFLYSGTGSGIAGTVVERVTGVSYASLLRERIFEPLDMDSSFVRAAEAKDSERVRTPGYRMSPDGTLELFDVPENRRVGGVTFSTRDLYRWVSSFYSRPLLSESALRAGLEPPVLGDGQRSGINLLNWYHPHTGRRFYFTGDNRGFYTFAYWDADRRHAFVYMSNTLLPNWLRPRLAIALVDILEGRRPAPVEDPDYGVATVPATSWDLYAGLPSPNDFAPILGEYEMEPAGRVTIETPPPNWLNVGWLLGDGWFAPVVRVDGGLTFNMFPVEPGMFYVPGLDAWAGFTESDGEPTLHWTQVFKGTSTGTRIVK
jgi:CubicO group peptidase (beta-lactamase class C family)